MDIPEKIDLKAVYDAIEATSPEFRYEEIKNFRGMVIGDAIVDKDGVHFLAQFESGGVINLYSQTSVIKEKIVSYSPLEIAILLWPLHTVGMTDVYDYIADAYRSNSIFDKNEFPKTDDEMYAATLNMFNIAKAQKSSFDAMAVLNPVRKLSDTFMHPNGLSANLSIQELYPIYLLHQEVLSALAKLSSPYSEKDQLLQHTQNRGDGYTYLDSHTVRRSLLELEENLKSFLTKGYQKGHYLDRIDTILSSVKGGFTKFLRYTDDNPVFEFIDNYRSLVSHLIAAKTLRVHNPFGPKIEI